MKENYIELEGLNQSRLKTILIHPRAFLKPVKKKSQGLTLGSCIDTLILDGRQVFDEKYKVYNGIFPTKGIKEVLDLLIEWKKFDVSSILSACNLVNYRARSNEDTRVGYITPYEDFFNLSIKDSSIISQEIYSQTLATNDLYEKNSFLQEFFKNKEIHKKKVFQWKSQNRIFKAELDLLLIDHNKKEVTEVDLKTSSSSIYDFFRDFKAYRYDFQRAFYNIPVTQYAKQLGYTVTNPYIIYLPTQGGNPILIKIPTKYITGNSWMDQYGNTIHSVKSALERLSWHEKEDLWEYPKEYYEQGYITLSI